jgi:hypothetical protein
MSEKEEKKPLNTQQVIQDIERVERRLQPKKGEKPVPEDVRKGRALRLIVERLERDPQLIRAIFDEGILEVFMVVRDGGSVQPSSILADQTTPLPESS